MNELIEKYKKLQEKLSWDDEFEYGQYSILGVVIEDLESLLEE